MISPGTRKLWSSVILQALKDAKGLRNVSYDGETGHYGASEARAWLDSEGRELMLAMGFAVERVNAGLADKDKLLRVFEGLAS